MCCLSSAWNEIAPLFVCNRASEKTNFGIWRNQLAPYFSQAELSDITTSSLVAFRHSLEQKGLSPQTVKHCLALLKRIINKAKLLNLYDGEMPYFPMPSFDNQRIRYLTKPEAENLLLVLRQRSHTWYLITLLALHTGMRAGEIFKLKCGHIDLNKSTVCIFDTKTAINRVIPLNTKAKEALSFLPKNPEHYVFKNTQGTPIKSAGKIFFNAVKAAGLNDRIVDRRQKVVFHTLRHTFASWLIQKQVPLERVSRLLGHRSLQMTMRYAHLDLQQQRYAVSCLENL